MLSERIRQARKRAGLSQVQLAARLGVTRGAVTNWEIPSRSNPCTAHLEQLANVTAVSFEWLATGRGQPAIVALEAPAVVRWPGGYGDDPSERQLLRMLREDPGKRLAVMRLMGLIGER